MRIQVNLLDPPNAMDGVETNTHLHVIHAPGLLVAITVEMEVFTGMGVWQRWSDKPTLRQAPSVQDWQREGYLDVRRSLSPPLPAVPRCSSTNWEAYFRREPSPLF